MLETHKNVLNMLISFVIVMISTSINLYIEENIKPMVSISRKYVTFYMVIQVENMCFFTPT